MRGLFLLLLPAVAAAHGGRTDANGCHNDRKRGGYHCHGGRAEVWPELEDLGRELEARAASEPDAGPVAVDAGVAAPAPAPPSEPPRGPAAVPPPRPATREPRAATPTSHVCLAVVVVSLAFGALYNAARLRAKRRAARRED